MKKKAQAALEFLMTYGWAILLVVVVVGALYATGMLKPCRWVGLQAKEFPLSEVKVVPIRLTSSELVFQVYYQQAGDATFVSATISGKSDGRDIGTVQGSNNVATFSSANPVTITADLTNKVSGGECVDLDVELRFIKPGTTEYTVVRGKITGPVS